MNSYWKHWKWAALGAVGFAALLSLIFALLAMTTARNWAFGLLVVSGCCLLIIGSKANEEKERNDRKTRIDRQARLAQIRR